MRARGILPIAAWILLAATACRPPVAAIPSAEPESQIANPASVFCVAHQGTLEIRTGEGGGQIGVCVFPDSSECEEWAYFRAECTPASEASSPEPDSTSATSGVEPLALTLISPQDGAVLESSPMTVSGTVSPGAVVTVNDDILIAGEDGRFQTAVAFGDGIGSIEVLASNAYGDTEHVKLALSDPSAASTVHVVPGEAANVHRVGTVIDYAPGASITLLATDGNTYSFALAADTRILPPGMAADLAVDDRVAIITPRAPEASGLTAMGIVVLPSKP